MFNFGASLTLVVCLAYCFLLTDYHITRKLGHWFFFYSSLFTCFQFLFHASVLSFLLCVCLLKCCPSFSLSLSLSLFLFFYLSFVFLCVVVICHRKITTENAHTFRPFLLFSAPQCVHWTVLRQRTRTHIVTNRSLWIHAWFPSLSFPFHSLFTLPLLLAFATSRVQCSSLHFITAKLLNCQVVVNCLLFSFVTCFSSKYTPVV